MEDVKLPCCNYRQKDPFGRVYCTNGLIRKQYGDWGTIGGYPHYQKGYKKIYLGKDGCFYRDIPCHNCHMV